MSSYSYILRNIFENRPPQKKKLKRKKKLNAKHFAQQLKRRILCKLYDENKTHSINTVVGQSTIPQGHLLGSKLKMICDIGYRRLFKYQFPSFIQNVVIITSNCVFAYCIQPHMRMVIVVVSVRAEKITVFGDECSGFIKFQFSL